MSPVTPTIAVVSLISLLSACNAADSNWKQPDLTPDASTGRWYDQSQAAEGRHLFSETCAACHGDNASGTSDWKTPDAQGNYPPPPLDGSAHAWHHSIDVLAGTIEEGGAKYGGQMPGFKHQYNQEQILALIAGFQSYWPEGTYRQWLEREKNARQ